MHDDDELDDPRERDNLTGLSGLRQRGRAAYAHLSNIEQDQHPTVPLSGPVEQLGLLRRRETGGALFEHLTPCLYIVRLDDGALAHGVELDKLDDHELSAFAALLARFALRVADERHRRLVLP